MSEQARSSTAGGSATDSSVTDSSVTDSSVTDSSVVDQIVDDLLPIDFDWRRFVRSYPLTSMAALVAGGFFVGRKHGTSLVTSLGAVVADEAQRNVQALFDRVGDGLGLGGDEDDEPDEVSDDEFSDE